MTKYNVGDRVVYKNIRGGNDRYNGQTGTVVGPGWDVDEAEVKWDTESWSVTPTSHPFAENISLIPTREFKVGDRLRTRADELAAEADVDEKAIATMLREVEEQRKAVARKRTLASQYRTVADDLDPEVTIDDLNALPVGTHLRDEFGDDAHWVKFEDGSWHLIEQEGGFVAAGTDWSPFQGDTAETIQHHDLELVT